MLPLTGAAVAGLCITLYDLPGFGAGGWWLLGGMGAYTLLAFVLPRPVVLYVIGHELTHALWSKLFGGKVSNLKVSRKGGSVRVSKVNTFVILAPYFFPLYTIMVGVVFVILSLFVKIMPYYHLLLFLIGFTLQFHYLTTGTALRNSQPDLFEAGFVFSLALIPLFNCIVLAVILQLVFFDMDIVMTFIVNTIQLVGAVYVWLMQKVHVGGKWLVARWNGENF
ncbi:MAG TPA: hypothetical protein PKM88_12180 [bacterium]|nr:hypothetical protein [bacterium]